MKRNFDLIRGILIDLEEWQEDVPLQTGNLLYDCISPKEINYHAKLLIDDGYIEGEIIPGNNGQPMAAILLSLTMKGHDFLENARENTIWEKVKKEAAIKTASVSLSVFQELLKAAMKAHLGL